MTGSTGPTGATRPPASVPRIIPSGLRRLAAAVWLAAVLASTAGAAWASAIGAAWASAGAVPFSITEIGPAPATGFKVSDIGAVPVSGYQSIDTTDPMADEPEDGDIDPR